jgi:hypothetical protein
MVTSNAADAMHWNTHVGRIQDGLSADLLVVDNIAENPYRTLIEAIDPDVRLSIVGGIPVFGDLDLMQAMNGNDYEIINGSGFQKAVDITYDSVEDGSQTFSFVESELTKAMRFDRQEMFDDWGHDSYTWSEFNAWLNQSHSTLGSVPLDPVFTYGDDRYFDVLNRSQTFNSKGAIDLYSRYYNVTFDANGNRSETFIPPDDPVQPPEDDDDDPVDEPECTEDDTKTVECNTCYCSDEVWVCTEMDCGSSQYSEDDGLSSSLLDPSSPLYWVMVFVALSVVFGSGVAVWMAFRPS